MGTDGTLVDLQEHVGKRLVALSHRDRASSHVMTWKLGGVLQSSAAMASIRGEHRLLTVQSGQLSRLSHLNDRAGMMGVCGT